MPKIMIVDDAAFMRMRMKETLTEAGFSDFVEARGGEEAVSLFEKFRPDLTLLDITMPVKDGIAALQDILGKDAAARVIMCSAMGQENLIIEAVRLGALDFIVKPFKPERLVQAVRNILG